MTKSSNGVEPTVSMEVITPEVAREMLATSPGNPRWNSDKEVYDKHVEKIARDMKAGRFYPTAAVLIDEDGRLIDAHHRLTAVIMAGVTITLPVIRGLPRQSVPTIDTDHLTRSLNQSANALDMEWLAQRQVAKVVKAMLKAMDLGPTYRSRQEELDFAKEHREAIEFTASLFTHNKKGLTVAPVQAAVARGYYHVPEMVLKRFARCLYTGMPEHDEDASVIRLRDFLLMNSYQGGAGQREVYAKAARAITAVKEGRALKALYAAPRDPFPLPGEGDDEKAE